MRADAFYRQLMDAAGYLRGVPVGTSETETLDGDIREDAVVRFLATQTGDDDLARRLLQLIRRYPELSPDEQTVVRYLVGTWVGDA